MSSITINGVKENVCQHGNYSLQLKDGSKTAFLFNRKKWSLRELFTKD